MPTCRHNSSQNISLILWVENIENRLHCVIIKAVSGLNFEMWKIICVESMREKYLACKAAIDRYNTKTLQYSWQ